MRASHQRALPTAPARAALEAIIKSAPRELEGASINPARLSREEGLELDGLVSKRRAGELSDAGRDRFERLVEKAAADPGLFERRRGEIESKAKLAELSRQHRRHPQAESLVAAVLGDATLFDWTRERLREIRERDHWNHERTFTTNARGLELDDVAALFLLVNAIAENGGHPVQVSEHGLVREVAPNGRLPSLPKGALGGLQLNEYLTVERAGSGYLVGLGPRVRATAAKWDIQLPTTEAPKEAATATA